jgi:nucleotide-binding universal stress UspA family protein
MDALANASASASMLPDAEVHLVTVVETLQSEIVDPADRKGSLLQATDHVRDRLSSFGQNERVEFHQRFPKAHPFRLIAHVRVGPVAESMAALAGEIGADLLVVGTHGRRGFQRVAMGSVAERTVRIAPCPVLVMRPKNTHVMDGVPAIEPPCPSCVDTRARTRGAQWWCEAHAVAPEPAHVFSRSARLDDPPQPAFGR